MCNALTVHLNDEPIYDIFFANDFNSLPELLAGQGIADRRVCIVTESNVAPLYLDEIRNQLDGKEHGRSLSHAKACVYQCVNTHHVIR